MGRLARGEELLVVAYARHGLPPPILRVAAVALTICCLALTVVRPPMPVLVGSLGAAALLLAYLLISQRWLGVVLTDRRLLLWSTVPVTRRPRGVLLDVPRGHVSIGSTSMLRFDENAGHAPVRLIFGGEFHADESALFRVLAGDSSQG